MAQGTCTWLTTPCSLPPLCPLYSHQIWHESLYLVPDKLRERKHFQSWQNRQLQVTKKVRPSYKHPVFMCTRKKAQTHTHAHINTQTHIGSITRAYNLPVCLDIGPTIQQCTFVIQNIQEKIHDALYVLGPRLSIK